MGFRQGLDEIQIGFRQSLVVAVVVFIVVVVVVVAGVVGALRAILIWVNTFQRAERARMYFWSAVEQVIEGLVMQGLVMQGPRNMGN